MTGTDGETRQPFLRTLSRSFRLVDLAALVAVPLVLVGVFLLPMEVRRAYMFSYTEPTLLTAFTANYVHLGLGHFMSNLGAYLIVAPIAYLLSALSGHRKRFYVAFVTFLFVFPFVLSYLNLAIERPGLAMGFSGVVLAFVGYLPLALASYLQAQFDLERALDLAAVLFFLGLALTGVLSYPSIETYGAAVASVLSAVLYARSFSTDRETLVPDVKAASRATGHFELAFIALFLLVLFILIGFPTPTMEGVIVNLYVHLLGYALGFIATYCTILLVRRLEVANAVKTGARIHSPRSPSDE